MSETKMIPTLAMVNEPRLRKLFAICGEVVDALRTGELDDYTGNLEEAMYGILLNIAPEYLPPDDTDDPSLRAGWELIIERDHDRVKP